METLKPLYSIGGQDWLKAFWMFLISTVISVVGDAAIQAFSNGNYSFEAIHWKEIGGAILVTVITYIQKNFFSNSNGEYMKKEVKQPNI